MKLAGQWQELLEGLPAGWLDARLRVRLEEPGLDGRAAAMLGPLQPVTAADGTLSFRVARAGSGPQPELARRLLDSLDRERIHAALELVSVTEATISERAPEQSLAEAWDAVLATLPPDWSDLLGEIELGSSDYVDRAALDLAPINPRRDRERVALRFRCARRSGYGASPGMVRRCLERCDADGIRGTVRALQVLSDTRLVQTQGPVWQLAGRTV